MTAIKLKIRSCFLEHTAPTDKVTETAADNCHKYARLSHRDLSSVRRSFECHSDSNAATFCLQTDKFDIGL